jgi:outer membrane protein TolC
MRIRAAWLALPSALGLAVAPALADDVAGAADEVEGAEATELPVGVATPAETGDAPDAAEMVAADPARNFPLTLDEAVELALQNNLDVDIQRFGPLIADDDETIAWGEYDPELYAEFGYSSFKDPNAFTLNRTTFSLEKKTDGVGGFRGILPWLGSSYDFSFTGSRTTTNSTIQGLSPELRSSFSLNLTQPLLKGLIWNQPWTRVKTTRIGAQQSLENFREEVMNTVARVEDSYWDLIATEEQKNVATKSLETALALLEQSKTEYEVGVASKVKVVESEAGVAEREFNLIRDENLFKTSQDGLVNLILGTKFTDEAAVNVMPTDRPEDFIEYDLDTEAATVRAFDLRPELVSAQQDIEKQKLQIKFAKNQRLPQFDVRLGYGNRGQAGEQNQNARCGFLSNSAVIEDPLNPGMVVTIDPRQACLDDPSINRIGSRDFEDSLDHFIEQDSADQFSARALFSIPLPNTGARAQVSKDRLLLRQNETSKRRLEQSIILEVRKAVRDIESAQEGIEAARRATAAATEQLRAETIRLEYGESTPFDVLQREEDLVQAQSREIGAFRTYRSSVTALHRAQGTILQNRNIAIDAVRPLR